LLARKGIAKAFLIRLAVPIAKAKTKAKYNDKVR